MNDRTAEDVTLLLSLKTKLEQSPQVRRRAAQGAAGNVSKRADEIATEAADSLLDIRRSAEGLSELLPKLLAEQPEGAAFDDALHEIGEELRHIHYHITNTRLFDYVVTDH